MLAERLDDNIFRVADAVDHQAELPAVGLQNHNIDDRVQFIYCILASSAGSEILRT